MRRELTARTRLDTLRKDAKRWLKALRAGEADASRGSLPRGLSAPVDPP